MRVAPPQSQMGWQGVQCLAGLADAILGPEGIGLVGVPAPTRTRGVGQRGLPGHRGAGLGLVGFEGRRKNLEQVVGGAATAVAKEGGGGTAAVQACKKGEKGGETQARLGLMCRTQAHTRDPRLPPSSFLRKSRWALGRLASFPPFLGSGPQEGRPRVVPGGKGPRPQEKWPLGSLCCAKLTTSWTSCPSSSSAVTLIFSLYWGREGVVTSHPCPEHFPSSFSHQSYLDLPSQAASCHLEPLGGG